MHSKSDHIKIMINDEADEIIEKHFKPLKNKYLKNLESMKRSDFVLNYVSLFLIIYLLYYKCHKINPK